MAGSESRPPTPDWDAIRRSYERREETVSAIAAKHGVTISALYRRLNKDGWLRRSGAKKRRRRTALLPRLYAILDQNIELMEQRMKSGEPATAAERERETRALSTLARTVGQISELTTDTTPSAGTPRSATTDRSTALEADRLRLELARRLSKLRERSQPR